MSNIQIFQNDEFGDLRTIAGKDEILFVAADVCNALGLGRQQDSTRYLDADEKGECLVDTPSGKQKMVAVTEAGFYRLVMKSRKPEAKAFQRWVTHEVLPAIRRRGGYMTTSADETPEQTMARALLIAKDALDRKDKEIADLKPKALFADAVATSNRSILVGELAKILKQNGVQTGQNRLFRQLREDGFLMKRNGNPNMPTQKAMELGLFEVKETSIAHSDGHVSLNFTTKVTPKGQIYLINRYCGVALF